jgi:1-acyl-sn-glycerol-3-phosphate acyltransferase
LAKNPHKKGQDLVSTRKAIKQLKRSPAAITSFIEGTRFTDEKKDLQNSPYTHLLKPKAGGISFIISAMGHQIHSLIDVTIVYPEHSSMWDFLCRRMDTIKVNLRRIPIPAEFTSSKLVEDKDLQDTFKVWINALWADKDQLITSLK